MSVRPTRTTPKTHLPQELSSCVTKALALKAYVTTDHKGKRLHYQGAIAHLGCLGVRHLVQLRESKLTFGRVGPYGHVAPST